MDEVKDMNTETVNRVVPPVVRPIPVVEGTETRRIRDVAEPRYLLVEKNGRYRLWTEEYDEYGRQEFLDLDVAEYISRRHFALKYENGQLYIKDLDSRNGTKVNGVDIRGKGWVPLKPGDVVEVANVITLVVTKVE